jgi:hypothetical protein
LGRRKCCLDKEIRTVREEEMRKVGSGNAKRVEGSGETELWVVSVVGHNVKWSSQKMRKAGEVERRMVSMGRRKIKWPLVGPEKRQVG